MTNFIANTIASPPDPRDFAFSPISTGNSITDLTHLIAERENQGSEGTCVAKSKNSLCETIVKQATGGIIDLSTAFVYQLGREISRLPAHIPGMIPRDALRAQMKYGIPLQAEWDYTHDNLTTRPPESVFASAATRKVSRFECVYNSSKFPGMNRDEKIDRIKAALAEGLPVSFAMMVTNSLGKLTGPWRGHKYQLCTANNMIGGHNQDVYANDDSINMFGVLNSWGEASGDNGIVGLPYSIVDEPFFEAWVIRGFMGMGIAETPGIKLEVNTGRAIDTRIVPPAHMLGKTVKVWIGAKLAGGLVYMKHALHNDEWSPLIGQDYKHCAEITLGEDNLIPVARNVDLLPHKGAKIVMAYGYSVFDWYIQELTTL